MIAQAWQQGWEGGWPTYVKVKGLCFFYNPPRILLVLRLSGFLQKKIVLDIRYSKQCLH